MTINDVEGESEGAVEISNGSEFVVVAVFCDGAASGDEVIDLELIAGVGVG